MAGVADPERNAHVPALLHFPLVEQSESDKIIPGMAFAFDIKSVSPERAVVLWGGQEISCSRIR